MSAELLVRTFFIIVMSLVVAWGVLTMHDEEKQLIEQLAKDFENVVVILNV